jgi:hypothetical protein
MVSQSKCGDAIVEWKINMLYKQEFCESVASVGRHFDISESSVRTIKESLYG